MRLVPARSARRKVPARLRLWQPRFGTQASIVTTAVPASDRSRRNEVPFAMRKRLRVRANRRIDGASVSTTAGCVGGADVVTEVGGGPGGGASGGEPVRGAAGAP